MAESKMIRASLQRARTVRSWLLLEIQLRSLIRRLRPRSPFAETSVPDGEYEHGFRQAMVQAIRKNDVVWDIGANVGLYTELFSQRVGDNGQVIAFEPAPGPFGLLLDRAREMGNVHALGIGLADTAGDWEISLSDDEMGSTHSFVQEAASNSRIRVKVERGDSARRARDLPTPSVIKIDVEGLELEVLRGLRESMDDEACRAVFCEVHFGLLERRGERYAPAEIVRLLRSHGFRVTWIDVSHLGAYRDAP